jgi:NADH oxidase (H2O2-forming)
MRIVVIGNGIGGFSAASTVRRLHNQCDVAMISKETTPLYSACVLPDYLSGRIPREGVFVKKESDYKQLGIRTYWGCEVKEVDPVAKKIFIDPGEPLAFDKLILATGSEPIVLSEPKRGIFKLKTLQDAKGILDRKGRKAVVVGAGPVGVEIGIALSCQGYKVSIVEKVDRVFPLGLDRKGAQKVKGMLEDRGIEVFAGEGFERVLGKEGVEGVVTEKRTLECDTLIWAVGMRPQVELARGAGIEIGEKRGIRVNSCLETSIPGIYACGDCSESRDILTGEPQLNLFWHNANRQGSVAARNCIGRMANYPGSQNILNVNVFGNHIAGFGLTEEALRVHKPRQAPGGGPVRISIIEREKNGGYYRLVMAGDRCMGGQFINIKECIGLLWSLALRREGMGRFLRIMEDEELLCHRPWLRSIRSFFRKAEIV